MTTYLPDDVDDEPVAVLACWQVFETPIDTRHFAGLTTDRIARVSSPIQHFDPDTRQGVTRFTRIYQLQGEPASDAGVEAFIGEWCSRYHIGSIQDVTNEYVANTENPDNDAS